MRLEEIIRNTGASIVHGTPRAEITSICSDSRQACPGALFIAVNGCNADGHKYIEAAIEAGASAVVSTDRHGLALCADNYFSHPSGQLYLVGITGTNGKTTTVTLLYNLFRSLGYECGMLSTIANYVGTRRVETSNTTSDPITAGRLMRQMVDEGCQYCFMEVSSIGVEQERITGMEFRIGIFSNLTHDHLDYHKTFAEYLRCKKLFFDGLGSDACAIINADDKNGQVMLQNCKARSVTYSCMKAADHNCRILEESLEGMMLNIDGTEVWTRLTGTHNAYNILAAYCTALELGADRSEVMVALSTLKSAPGRLETIAGKRGISVVIDYAHTPDALDNVLASLKEIAPERQLVCVFGCGGDRDRSKRPEMAAVAGKYADRIFVTSDNSRTERTEDIISEIMKGFSREELSKVISISDRAEAINAAITTAPDGATVLLAGKGHETYQIIGTEKKHFDEREIVNGIFDRIKE